MSTTEDRRVDLEPGALGLDLCSLDDGSPLVSLSGEIDAATVGRLEACLDAVVRGGARTVTIGLAGVTFMDSSGINAILELRRRLGPGGRVHLRNCSASIRRVCDITGVTDDESIIVD